MYECARITVYVQLYYNRFLSSRLRMFSIWIYSHIYSLIKFCPSHGS